MNCSRRMCRITVFIGIAVAMSLILLLLITFRTIESNSSGQKKTTTSRTTSAIRRTTTTSRFNNILCNITSCRNAIINYFEVHQFYNTSNLPECNGCESVVYPNFPNWSSYWRNYDFVIFSFTGHDLTADPSEGDLATCQYLCLRNLRCAGFSRDKGAFNGDTNALCWFKNDISRDRSYGEDYYTWVFSPL